MSLAKTGQILSTTILLVLTDAARAEKATPADSERVIACKLRVSVQRDSRCRYIGEYPVLIDVAIVNSAKTPLAVLKFWKLLWTHSLDFSLTGDKTGIVGSIVTGPATTKPTANDYNEIPPGGTLTFPVNIQQHLSRYPRKADKYTLKAVLKLRDGSTIRDECFFVIKPVPKLQQLQQLRIRRATQGSHFFLGVDVGLAPTAAKKSTLLFVVRESETGKTKLREPPERTLRLMSADPKARIETMVYNPFPLSRDPIIEVHVLVTDPNKPQHYFVIDLSLGATLKKKQTLKRGMLYKLHKVPLGSVKLVPRGSK